MIERSQDELPAPRGDWLRHAVAIAAPVAQEAARTALLLVLLWASVWVILENLRGGADAAWYERLWRTLAEAGRDANGVAIAPRFFAAARESLAIVLGATVLLGVASFVLGAKFALRPSASALRLPLSVVSAVPAFMLPFLGVPISTGWFWPAVCLAVGDLNLTALTARVFDGLRRELDQPYVRTSRALGLSVWSDLWPRATLITLDGLRARIPHLLGGTVAIELAYNVHGIGHLALNSVLAERPDYNTLVWIAGLGIIATRVLSLSQRLLQAVLTPERGRQSAWAVDSGGLGLAGLLRSTSRGENAAARPLAPEVWFSSVAVGTRTPSSRWTRTTQKFLAYWRVLAVHRVKVVLACAILCCGLVVAAIVLWGGGYTMLDQDEPLMPSSSSHPLGTNDESEDVLSKIALGGRQLVVPIAAALATAVLIGGVFGTVAGLSLRSVADTAMDLIAELWESVPKLVVVLAAITYMSYEHYELKVFLVIGLAFAPLMFRAVRDEVGALRTSLFLEASITLGVPRRRILWAHVLKNHALPVLAVEAAVLVGYLLLFDAILGYCRVRQRSEVFTWGSLLGTGIDDLTQQLDAGLAANSMVAWGPFAAMLAVIVVSAIVGDALKSLGRNVRASQ